jgi:Ca-activated chloride channel family protein
MSFEWPLLLFGLLLVPLALLGYLLVQRRRPKYAVRFTNLDLLANVVERSPGWRRHVPAVLVLLALAALLTSLARPYAVLDVPKESGTVVLAMDVSGSMQARDIEPDRMGAAREAAQDFVEGLPDDFRVGIVSFSTEAQVALTPTEDREIVLETLEGLNALGGTAIGDAIARSVELRRATGEEAFAVLLLSDGTNTHGQLRPEQAAERAQEAGVPVHTIALGTDDGIVRVPNEFGEIVTVRVPPNRAALRDVAETTEATFADAPNADALEEVYDRLSTQVGFEEEKRDLTVAFAAAGTLLLLIGATLSALWFQRLP